MRVLMLGAPGSGKGTHGARVAARHGVPHVSTGELLRELIAADSELGRSRTWNGGIWCRTT
jgi:adenylate kinase